jgi:hypothetical protein
MAVQLGDVRLNGAGNLSVNLREQRQRISAVFGGSGSLSAVDTVIQLQVSFVSTSFLQAIADRSLAEMVGNPKARLVLAVEIKILPLT